MDSSLQKIKREYDLDSTNVEIKLRYCREYARAGMPESNKKKCLAPWCGSAVKNHVLCLHHRTPQYYDALGLPPKLTFPEDWHYVVDCEYENEYSCDDYGCDDICRCGVIVNARVEEICGETIASMLLASTGQFGPITAYAIARMTERLLEPSSFWVSTTRGYYGEEIDKITLDDSHFRTAMEALVKLPPNDQVRESLKLEYGFILPELETCEFEIQTISTKKLAMRKEHAEKIQVQVQNNAVMERYKVKYAQDYNNKLIGPKGVVIQQEEGYRLIDGYHRLTAWKAAKGNAPISMLVALTKFSA